MAKKTPKIPDFAKNRRKLSKNAKKRLYCTCPWGGSGSSGHSFSGLIHDIPQAPSHKQSFLSFKQSLSVLHLRGHGLFLPFFSSCTDSVCLGGHSSGFVNP